MATVRIRKPTRPSRLVPSVGRRAKIRFGHSDLPVVIIEDRGAVGSSGRRLVRVRPVGTADEIPPTFEVPADKLIYPKFRPQKVASATGKH